MAGGASKYWIGKHNVRSLSVVAIDHERCLGFAKAWVLNMHRKGNNEIY